MTDKNPKRRRKSRKKVRIQNTITTFIIRWGVRLFGSGFLKLLLIPFTWYHYFRRKEDRCKFAKIREALPAEFWGDLTVERHYYRMLHTWYATVCVPILYDLLDREDLAKHFQIMGKRPQDYPRDRPLIVVFLHAGGFGIIRALERSRGMAAASYGALPKILTSLQKVFRRGDQRYQLTGVLHYLLPGAPRELVKFVKPGRMLCIAADGLFDQWTQPIDSGGVILHLNDGAIKLAIKSGAILIPAWVDQKGAFDFRISYGDAVPDSMLQRKEETTAALEYLARQFWQHAKANPEALTWTTLGAIAPEKRMKRERWP